MPVQTYSCVGGDAYQLGAQMERDDGGDWVSLDDYESILNESISLREENERLNRFVKECGTTLVPCPKCGLGMLAKDSQCTLCELTEVRQELDRCRKVVDSQAKTFEQFQEACYDRDRFKQAWEKQSGLIEAMQNELDRYKRLATMAFR